MLTLKTPVEDGIVSRILVEDAEGNVEASGTLDEHGVWDVKIKYAGRTVAKCFTDFGEAISELAGFMGRHNALLAQDEVVNRAEEFLEDENTRYCELSEAHNEAVFHNGSWT